MTNTTFVKMVRRYYWLAKPGIVYGNLFTAIAAYIFGAKGFGNVSVFFGMIVGVALVIACGCVLNNIYDKDIDMYMERTKSRSLVTRKITTSSAVVYAAVLGGIGFTYLVLYTNIQTVICGVVGLVFYVPIYTIAKRRTVHGTLIGTISGATPPVAGYVAATSRFDITALLLFLTLVTWQMPHFYAIAVRRLDDYKKAGIPVLPAVKGIAYTVTQIRAYIAGFIICIVLLSIYADAGVLFGVCMSMIGIRWLIGSTASVQNDVSQWAKRVFSFSLLSLFMFNVLLAASIFVR